MNLTIHNMISSFPLPNPLSFWIPRMSPENVRLHHELRDFKIKCVQIIKFLHPFKRRRGDISSFWRTVQKTDAFHKLCIYDTCFQARIELKQKQKQDSPSSPLLPVCMQWEIARRTFHKSKRPCIFDNVKPKHGLDTKEE